MTEENPIIVEIRETRDRLLAEHGGDLNRLIDELQRASNRAGNESIRRGNGDIDESPPKKVG